MAKPAGKPQEVIARSSIETRHLETLLNGQTLPPEVAKKLKRDIHLAKVRAEYDASNG